MTTTPPSGISGWSTCLRSSISTFTSHTSSARSPSNFKMSYSVKNGGTTCVPRTLPNALVTFTPEIGWFAESSGVIFSFGATAPKPSFWIVSTWSYSSPVPIRW